MVYFEKARFFGRHNLAAFEDYINSIPEALSDVKLKIIRRLWQEGTAVPRGWVLSSELLSLTKQKYFDRRVRELRDEAGCDIETGRAGGNHVYRLRSLSIVIAHPRAYLNEDHKRSLFAEYRYRCAVCDRRFDPGVRGLQADHKVPLIRGGTIESSNWQPLCVECNVGKRRACADCRSECSACPWAFPERLGHRLVMVLNPRLGRSVTEYAAARRTTIPAIVSEAIEEYLKKGRS